MICQNTDTSASLIIPTLLSVFLLQRLIDEIADNLPPNQFGFRRKRGTRDAIFLLSTFIDEQLEAGNNHNALIYGL